MPTIDEIRDWLRGEEVPGMPSAADLEVEEEKEPPAPEQVEDSPRRSFLTAARLKYKLSSDGTDAVLLFGRWKSHSVSSMCGRMDGIKYLDWMVTAGFPEDLVDVIKSNRMKVFEAGIKSKE